MRDFPKLIYQNNFSLKKIMVFRNILFYYKKYIWN